MAKKPHETPMLDELEKGPWPSFVTGLKRLAQDNDMAVDLLGRLLADEPIEALRFELGTRLVVRESTAPPPEPQAARAQAGSLASGSPVAA